MDEAIARPGEQLFPRLFEPAQWGRLRVKNRIKYGACCVSNYNTHDGFITGRELARTRVIAQTGCGIITNQGAYPDPLGEGKAYFRQVALFDDKFLPQFEEIAGYIHDAGAIAIQQILHAGRYGGIDLGYCIQPSAIPQTLPHFRPPREITKEEIRVTIKQHAEAARRAVKAGFDGTEITSFMGYLLANFCSRFTNKRSDEYGGSIENRGRFMREMIQEIKEATPDHPLVVRLNGAELMDRWGGNSEEECQQLMLQAAQCGVDMISVTVGWQEAPESSIGRDIPPGHWNHLAAKAKRMVPGVPIAFGVRLPDAAMAEACIRNGEFDYWEVCRPFLADPDAVHKIADNRPEEIRRCIGSLNCLSRLFRDLPYTCTVNAALGHEGEGAHRLEAAAIKKQVMVIGAGPGGMECAIAARRRGHAVTVFERGDRIGGALFGYASHDLAHRDDLFDLIRWYEVMAGKLGIEVRLATEVDPKLMRSVLHRYDAAVIATGARIDMDRLPVSTQDGLLQQAHEVAVGRVTPGERVVVIGGGKIGLTLAESLAARKHSVTVVESERRIAGDVMPSFKWRHTQWIEELAIPVMTSTRVEAVGSGGVTVVDGNGERSFLPADTVIAAVRAQPNQELFHALEWMVDEIHGCGDALVPLGLTRAIHDGYRLGARL
jgi:2,4-dienoyl-CoA reductase (NADPH2)